MADEQKHVIQAPTKDGGITTISVPTTQQQAQQWVDDRVARGVAHEGEHVAPVKTETK